VTTGGFEPGSDAPEGTGPSLATTASRGFLWANLGIFTRYASALVLAAVLARVLSTEDYAVMVTLMLLTFYLDNALDLGVGAALVYEQEKGITDRVQVAFTANVALGGVLAVLALALAPLVGSFFQQDGFTTLFRCLAVVVVLSAFNTVPWALFMRNMDFRRRAGVEVARDLTRFVVTIGLAFAGFGAWSVVLGLFGAYAVALVLTWWALRFRPRFRWDGGVVRELVSYAWRVAGNRLLGILALNGDYFVVGNRRNDQYPTYYQAFRLPEFVMGAQLNALSAVLFPMYSRIRAEGDVAMREAMYRALRIVSLFSFPVGIFLALVARDAFTVMYGTESLVGIRTMEVIALTGAITGLGFATGDLLMAIGRPGVLLRLNAVMVPVMLAVMWFVAPYGVVWVATVHLGTQMVFLTIRQLIVNRITSASAAAAARCLTPGLVVAVGVSVLALPARLLTGTGFWSLVLVTAAAGVGGAAAVMAYRPARDELSGLVAKVRG
jgi:lipopolysaccharide exporter